MRYTKKNLWGIGTSSLKDSISWKIFIVLNDIFHHCILIDNLILYTIEYRIFKYVNLNSMHSQVLFDRRSSAFRSLKNVQVLILAIKIQLAVQYCRDEFPFLISEVALMR